MLRIKKRNTNINIHNAPIVCLSEDAVNRFLKGGVNYLAIGPFIVVNPGKLNKEVKQHIFLK